MLRLEWEKQAKNKIMVAHPEQLCRSSWRSSQEVVALAHSNQHALQARRPKASKTSKAAGWQGGWMLIMQPRFFGRTMELRFSVHLLCNVVLKSGAYA